MHDIFALTDVHGHYDLYRAAIDWCTEQDSECSIIYCGDACDRGPNGYRIMRELLDNPQVVYLKGNHEDMFARAARFIINDYNGPKDPEVFSNYLHSLAMRDYYASQVADCLYNGGRPTLMEWFKDGMSNEFVSRIDKLPLTFSTDTMDFCHAGARYDIFESVADDEYEDEIPDKDDAELLFWDRNYLNTGWASERICIHGHTPVFHLPSKLYGMDKSRTNAHPCMYTGLDEKWTGKKLDMDVGTATNGKLYVLNCLTLRVQGFQDMDFGNDEIKNHQIEKIEVIQF